MNLVYSLDGAKLGKVKCPNPLKFLKCTGIILKERGKSTQYGWGFSDLWILIDSFWGVANARFRMEGAARRKKLSAVETPQIEYKLLLLWAGCGFRGDTPHLIQIVNITCGVRFQGRHPTGSLYFGAQKVERMGRGFGDGRGAVSGETPQIEYKLLLLWAGCGFRERRYLIMMEYGYTLGVSRLSRL